MVIGRECRGGGVFAAQQSRGERNPRNYSDPCGLRGRKHLIERLQAECVQDDLDTRDPGAGDRGERLIGGLHTGAVGGDGAVGDEGVEGVVDGIRREHRGGRAVQLHEIERVDAEIFAGAVGPFAKLGKCEVLGHLSFTAPHLGGDGEAVAGVVGEVGPDELLAAAVAVDIRGVEEGDSGFDRSLENGPRGGVVDITPICTQLPGAETDHGYSAAGAAQGSSVHSPRLSARAAVQRCSTTCES